MSNSALLSRTTCTYIWHEQAAMNSEGKVGWEEIVDSQLEGKFNLQELNDMAALAYRCINRLPRRRPSMRDIVQVLTRILKSSHSRKKNRHHHEKSVLTTAGDEVSIDMDQSEGRGTPILDRHQREESMDSTADTFEV